MEIFKLISLEEAFDFTSRRPGLLLGPGATRSPGDLASIVRNAFSRARVDNLVSQNASDEDLRLALDCVETDMPDKAFRINQKFGMASSP